MGKSNPKWKEYEQIAADIQRQLVGPADVRHDDRIKGKSGTTRKIDISIRQKIGTYPVLIALDCKERSRPVSLSYVGAFSEQIDDIDVNLGVIISNRGFTKGAIRAAARHGRIMLQTLRAAESADWEALVGKSAWGALLRIRPRVLKAFAVLSTDRNVELPPATLVWNGYKAEEGQSLIDLFDTVARKNLPPIGKYSLKLTVQPGPALIQVGGDTVQVREFKLLVDLSAQRWMVNEHLAMGHVLRDADGNIVFSELRSVPRDWAAYMASQPFEELSSSVYAEMWKAGATAYDLTDAKRFVRLHWTHKYPTVGGKPVTGAKPSNSGRRGRKGK